jgi:hypothetical protein
MKIKGDGDMEPTRACELRGGEAGFDDGAMFLLSEAEERRCCFPHL